MGKLLHRIFRNELQARLPSLLGRTVQLQLNNGKTLVGTLRVANSQQPLLVTDFLGRKHSIEWLNVDEVLFDEVRA